MNKVLNGNPSSDAFKKFTVSEIFDLLKANPVDIVFSFYQRGKRYHLSGVSSKIKDPIVGLIQGSMLWYYQGVGKERVDIFKFVLPNKKIYVWYFR